MAAIERIDLLKIIPTPNYNHTVYTVVKGFDPNKHRILLRIDNSIYDTLDFYTNKNIYIELSKKETTYSFLNLGNQKPKTITIYAQLYDFQHDKILDTKKQDFTEAAFFSTFQKTGQVKSTLSNFFASYWNRTRRVDRVEGPFTTAECTTLATEIKTATKYYFTATPKQYLNPTELLLMKWQYRYDDGEFTDFNYAIETQSAFKNVMSCVFHANPEKIQVYAFFKEPSNEVSIVLSINKTDVTETQNQEVANEVQDATVISNLVWGSKVNEDFRKKVVKIAKELWPGNWLEMANGLMAVMYRETSGSFASNQLEGYKSLIPKNKMVKDDFYKISPGSGNKISRAIGLIQFTQNSIVAMKEFKNGDGFDRLHGIKLTYAKMKETEQLDKVKKYMLAVKTLPKTPEDIYVAVFAPQHVGKPLSNTMYRRGTENYSSNASLDKDNNGIQMKELIHEFYSSLSEGSKKENLGLVETNEETVKPTDNKPDSNNNTIANSNSTAENNEYKIYIDEYKIEKTKTNPKSNKFIYLICEKGNIINTFELESNKYKLLPFPQKGKNWGRYGIRDKRGDNWIREDVCAELFGFFYSLPKNNYNGYLYYNDISANDKRNIGHEGHKVGNDIDIRYPGSNDKGQTFWYDAKKKFKNEDEFVKVLENILSVATKWRFNKNYAYKKKIKHTTGKALSVHQDHFHLGLR